MNTVCVCHTGQASCQLVVIKSDILYLQNWTAPGFADCISPDTTIDGQNSMQMSRTVEFQSAVRTSMKWFAHSKHNIGSFWHILLMTVRCTGDLLDASWPMCWVHCQ